MEINDQIIYGARSGIQKAIRRGEPSLAKACFDILWDIPTHRKWLMWRMPVLVFEDCWHMAGELAELKKNVKQLDDAQKRNVWLKFLMRLTIARKNQDAAHLWYLALHGGMVFDHDEYRLMEAIALKCGRKAPDSIPAFAIHDYLQSELARNLDDYEKEACAVIDGRRTSGGMESDKWNALGAIVLIYTRGLPKNEILEMIDSQKGIYADEKLGALDELPLYCFDMHTRVGGLAKRVFLKNHKTRLIYDEEHLDTMWFQFESAMLGERVKPEYCHLLKGQKPAWHESMWEKAKYESLAKWYGVSVEEMIGHWKQQRGKMFDIVSWALKKTGK